MHKSLIMKSITNMGEWLSAFHIGLLLFLLSVANAQVPEWQWAKSAGGTDYDRGASITSTNDGNFLVAGTFQGSASFDTITLTSDLYEDIFIAKYQSDGTLLWAKSAASSGSGGGFTGSVFEDNDGNIYLAGTFGYYSVTGGGGDITFDEETSFTSYGNQDIFLARYDADGNFDWAEHVGSWLSDKCVSTIDVHGNIIISGKLWETVYFNEGSDTLVPFHGFDIFLAKYDPLGALLFYNNAASCTGTIEPQSVTSDRTGSIFLAGKYNGRPTFGLPIDSVDLEEDLYYDQGFLARYDPLGGFFNWAYTAGNTSTMDYPTTINTGEAGKILMSGTYLSSASFGIFPDTIRLTAPPAAGYGELYLVQYDTSGNAEWAINAGHALSGAIYCNDAYYSNEHLYLTGDFSAGPAVFGQGIYAVTIPYTHSIFIANYNDTGNLDWVKSAGGGYYESSQSLTADSLDNIYFAGFYLIYFTFPGTSITLTSEGYEDIMVGRLGDASVGVPENMGMPEVFISPNPASDNLLITFANEGEHLIKVWDMTGKVILQKETRSHQVGIDLEGLVDGIYIIAVSDEAGRNFRNKLVKF